MRIALISDITPVPLTAGPLVLYNHYLRMSAHECLVVSGAIPQPDPADRHWRVIRVPRKLRWLARPALYPVFEELRARQVWREISDDVTRFRPDVIVTVWAGEFLLPAAIAAGELARPLVLICHDDFERMLPDRPHVRLWARRRLGEIYRAARTRLCVSPAMADDFDLRYGAPGRVLYPLGGASDTPTAGDARTTQPAQPLRYGYAGRIGGEREPLSALANVLHEHAGELHIATPTKGAARDALMKLPAVRDVGELTAPDVRNYFSRNADVMVVPQSFAPEERSLVATNFPSKLVDASRFGLPVLVIAPPYASAARWAQRVPQAVELAGDYGAASMARAITRLADADVRMQLARNLGSVAATQFAPDAIHGVFERALQEAIAFPRRREVQGA